MITAALDHADPGRRRRGWAAQILLPELLGFALLALIVALPPMVRGELIGRGEITHEYSIYAYVKHELRMGRMPLWNPYTVSGNPGLADPVANVFYPFTAPLLTVLSVAAAINVMIIVHMILAGAFMHLYLGSLRLSRPARFLGAVAYMLSGFVAWRILSGDIPRLATYAWMPLLFLIVEEIASGRRGMGAALLGGIVIAVQFFAGDPQTFVYASLALVAYAGFRIAALAKDRGSRANVRRAAAVAGAMFALGAGFASVQALPTLEELSLSNRAGFGADFALLGSIPPAGLVSLIAPRVFGDEIHGRWGEQELLAPEFYPHAATLYTGFFTIVLAIVALLTRRDRWHVRFFAVLGVAVLWLALGKFGYIYRAVTYVPLLRSFRDIENINILVPMSASVLAAVGFERYLEPGSSSEVWSRALRGMALTVGLGVIVMELTLLAQRRIGLELLSLRAVRHAFAESTAFVIIAWVCSALLLRDRSRRETAPAWLIAVAICFLVADLLYSAAPLIAAGTDIRSMAQADGITEFLAQDRSLYRVSGFYDRGPLFGVQDVEGEPSLLLARYQEYTDALQGYDLNRYSRAEGPHGVAIRAGFNSPLLALLNVKYSIFRASELRTTGRRDPSQFVRIGHSTIVYRHPRVFPRVLASRGYRVLHERAAILSELNRAAYDPHAFVVLEEQPALPPGFTAAPDAAGPPARLSVAAYENSRVIVKADFARPGFLVLNDLYYPAWRAELDGRPTLVYRANYLFRAVVVPAGSHEVRFVYRDGMLALGGAIAILTGVCGIAAWLIDRKYRRAPRGRGAR